MPMLETIICRSSFGMTLADVALHSRYVLVGHLQARAGGSLHVDHELAGIGAREEGDAEQREPAPG